MKIRTNKGLYPLTELVNFNIDNKIVSINRKNGSKIIEIEGELASENAYSSDIISEVEKLFPIIKEKYPSVRMELAGSSDEGTITANSMKKIMPVFGFLILCIVLITFRSKAQTFLVFLLMPFTLVGVYFGHLLHGMPISVLSGFGVVALIGVLVNDALVFITSFNLRLKKGESFLVALEITSINRFRPIILTTITTVFGLLPLIFEKSMQAQFLIPMAISLSYGIIMATLLTLLFLPVLLLTVNNIRLFISRNKSREEVEPAVKRIKEYVMIKYLLLISFFSFSQEIITLEKAIQYAIDNSNNIKIAKNDLIINDNNTSLGSAGLLPSIIISSGYNSSVSNSELKLNSFLDFGGESMNEINANNATSTSFSSSLGINYTLFNGFSGDLY